VDARAEDSAAAATDAGKEIEVFVNKIKLIAL
jgi:hypothetical protein